LAYSSHGYNINIDYVRLNGGLGVTEQQSHSQPVITALCVTKPNPITNELTHISFSLAEPSQVSLKIYNTSGRLVKTLVNEFKGTGVYNVNWNCRDDVGQTVAKGVYFCTLESPKHKFCKKLILIQN
jgi:flagellar hook assembly protein FlgD